MDDLILFRSVQQLCFGQINPHTKYFIRVPKHILHRNTVLMAEFVFIIPVLFPLSMKAF